MLNPRKGQVGAALPVLTAIIVALVIAGLGAFVLSSVGNQDNIYTTFTVTNESLGALTTNTSTVTLAHGALTQTTIYNASLVQNGNGNFTITNGYDNDIQGYQAGTVRLISSNQNTTVMFINYTYRVQTGVSSNFTGNSNQALSNFTGMMPAFATVAGAVLLIGLIAAFMGKR